MPDQELAEEHELDTRLSVLASNVERMTEQLREVTHEMRRTNETVQAQQMEARLDRERMGTISREIWTRDNSSRIRSLELHVKGIQAMLGFLLLTVLGRLAPSIIHFFIAGN